VKITNGSSIAQDFGIFWLSGEGVGMAGSHGKVIQFFRCVDEEGQLGVVE
jgi:hypothetical protein